jgi:hypothetical protein
MGSLAGILFHQIFGQAPTPTPQEKMTKSGMGRKARPRRDLFKGSIKKKNQVGGEILLLLAWFRDPKSRFDGENAQNVR